MQTMKKLILAVQPHEAYTSHTHKRHTLAFCAFLLLMGLSHSVIIANYTEANAEGYTEPLNSASQYGYSQSFTNANSVTLDTATFYIHKNVAPTGNVVAKIWSHAGTYGTSSVPGTKLATSDNVNVSTLGTTSALVNFTFSGANQITLNASTRYVIEIYYANSSGTSRVDVEIDGTSATHSGNIAFCYFDGDACIEDVTDLIFYVYGTEAGGAVANLTNITQIHVQPTPAHATSNLSCNLTATDTVLASGINITGNWTRNGTVLSAFTYTNLTNNTATIVANLTGGGGGSGTPITFESSASTSSSVTEHTITGSNNLVVVGVYSPVGVTPSAVKIYRGGTEIDMTFLHTETDAWGGTLHVWYALGQGTGYTYVATTITGVYGQVSAVYNGVYQTSFPDSHNGGNNELRSIVVATTVNASNSWLAGFAGHYANSGAAITSNRTDRRSQAFYNNWGATLLSDSNGTVGTGSQGINFTGNDVGAMNGIVFSIRPASTGGAANFTTGDNISCQAIATGSNTSSLTIATNVTITTAGVTNSCSCPVNPANWTINLADNCNITTSCDITGYYLTYNGTGTVTYQNTTDRITITAKGETLTNIIGTFKKFMKSLIWWKYTG
jgi:hypothetical protein